MKAVIQFCAVSILASGLAAQPASVPATAARPPLARSVVALRASRSFALVDANRDGLVSSAEVQSELNRRVQIKAQRRAARAAKRAALFSQLDRNRDSMVSKDEFIAIDFEPVVNRQVGQPTGDSPAYSPKTFKRADRNGDGLLSLAEITTERLARFDRDDTNHDGVLSTAEQGIPKR